MLFGDDFLDKEKDKGVDDGINEFGFFVGCILVKCLVEKVCNECIDDVENCC